MRSSCICAPERILRSAIKTKLSFPNPALQPIVYETELCGPVGPTDVRTGFLDGLSASTSRTQQNNLLHHSYNPWASKRKSKLREVVFRPHCYLRSRCELSLLSGKATNVQAQAMRLLDYYYPSEAFDVSPHYSSVHTQSQ